jgi:hypothetical protein
MCIYIYTYIYTYTHNTYTFYRWTIPTLWRFLYDTIIYIYTVYVYVYIHKYIHNHIHIIHIHFIGEPYLSPGALYTIPSENSIPYEASIQGIFIPLPLGLKLIQPLSRMSVCLSFCPTVSIFSFFFKLRLGSQQGAEPLYPEGIEVHNILFYLYLHVYVHTYVYTIPSEKSVPYEASIQGVFICIYMYMYMFIHMCIWYQ